MPAVTLTAMSAASQARIPAAKQIRSPTVIRIPKRRLTTWAKAKNDSDNDKKPSGDAIPDGFLLYL